MHGMALGLVVVFYLWLRSYSERAFFERGWVFDKVTRASPARVSAREALAFLVGVNAMGALGWLEQLWHVLPLGSSTVSSIYVGWLGMSLCIHVGAAVWLQRMFRRAGIASGARGDTEPSTAGAPVPVPATAHGVDAAHAAQVVDSRVPASWSTSPATKNGGAL